MNERSPRRDQAVLFMVTFATLLGGFVRLAPVLRVDFPLNDGGMFYSLAGDLLAADLRLPAYSSYNAGLGGEAGVEIPFTYPPLAFYLIACLSRLTGIGLLDLLRVAPALIATLAIPAFYLLARPILKSPAQASLATFAFAMLPRTYEWMIMGGGITRAPGYLFAILTLASGYRLYQNPRPLQGLLTGLLAGLTALTHPEMDLFIVFSLGLMVLFFQRGRTGLAFTGLAACVAAVVSAPWWLHALQTHGPGPLLAAFGSGHRIWFTPGTILMFDLTFEVFLNLIGAAALLGLLACLVRRQRFLPVWILTIALLYPRNAATLAAIPLAMLAAAGFESVIIPGIRHLSGLGSAPGRDYEETGSWPLLFVRPAPVRYLMFGFGLYAFLGAYLYPIVGNSVASSLPASERQAMAWIASNTLETSQFLVVSGIQYFWQDQSSEWLPALSGRVSLGTVQGTEWLPGKFYTQWGLYAGLQDCGMQTVDCLEDWARANRQNFTHIYLPKRLYWDSSTSNAALQVSLAQMRGYLPVYENEAVIIYAREKGELMAGQPDEQ